MLQGAIVEQYVYSITIVCEQVSDEEVGGQMRVVAVCANSIENDGLAGCIDGWNGDVPQPLGEAFFDFCIAQALDCVSNGESGHGD